MHDTPDTITERGGIALDAAAECEAWLREAGLAVAAAYAHEATAYLRLAIKSAVLRIGKDHDSYPNTQRDEPLVTEIGDDTGFHLTADESGLGLLRRSRNGDQPSANLPAAAHVRDLGWELAVSADARAFACDPLAAGLLRRAIQDAGWIAVDCGSRWSTSATGAATIVRLMRQGAPAVALRRSPRGILDAKVVALLASMGWSPESRSIMREADAGGA